MALSTPYTSTSDAASASGPVKQPAPGPTAWQLRLEYQLSRWEERVAPMWPQAAFTVYRGLMGVMG